MPFFWHLQTEETAFFRKRKSKFPEFKIKIASKEQLCTRNTSQSLTTTIALKPLLANINNALNQLEALNSSNPPKLPDNKKKRRLFKPKEKLVFVNG
jgi:hypothetical protein